MRSFGKRAGNSWLMGPPGIHPKDHVDGNAQVEVVVTPVGPSVSQVHELKSESAGVGRESDNQVGQEASTLLSVGQL